MSAEREKKQQDRMRGVPGGTGRRDEGVGGSGVYPASAGNAPEDAEIRTQAAWGQGDRGAAGYEDTGPSELNIPNPDLEEDVEERGSRGGEERSQ
jgi:hypothetical protein